MKIASIFLVMKTALVSKSKVEKLPLYQPRRHIVLSPAKWIERGVSIDVVRLCANTPLIKNALSNLANSKAVPS